MGRLPLPLPAVEAGGPGRLPFPAAAAAAAASALPASNRLRLSSIMFCISVLLLSNSDTLEPLMDPPVRIMPSLASSSVAKTINASPCSPPTICTPPSGMVNPEKKWRMSMVPATMGRPCKRMTTAILRRYKNTPAGERRHLRSDQGKRKVKRKHYTHTHTHTQP